ncbi:2520fdaf-ed28-4500-a6da-3a74cc812454 [Sclerotinia trifoliorum]|uniref:2520fdaf-ed28-4500-a6da-3a74cc812454 n=1 Tax=Sclerotinia trifoliorum TaxID=28548 RepID=A0A8H2W221_9HELO|nr:2520fdaf-ed28-4500-a6da-3a74cc812454 [Sclerotinia trifoliorum]
MQSLFLMAFTFALPYTSFHDGSTDLNFDNEQASIPNDQEREYDADVEEESKCEVDSLIYSPTQTASSTIIVWRTFNTTQSGTAGVEVAQVDIAAQAEILKGVNWHAVRTSQIGPLQTDAPQCSGWTPINVRPTNTSQISRENASTSDAEDTQASVAQSTCWSVTSGSQTDTSQATSIEADNKSSSYPQMQNTLNLRRRRIVKSVMSTMVDIPQLKVHFKRCKKEYCSVPTKEKIKWFRHRTACLNMGRSVEYDPDMAVLTSEWHKFLERRRWLKSEMLRTKNLYKSSRRRRQESTQCSLRASYDIAFIKSLAES